VESNFFADCDVDASVARIVLRHPPLNVIDIPMMEELAQALARDGCAG
jgi:enoyl-CoA hydratase/carnithine racemase